MGGKEKSCKPPIMIIMMNVEICFEIQISCKNRSSPTKQMNKCCCNNFKLETHGTAEEGNLWALVSSLTQWEHGEIIHMVRAWI